MWSSQSLQSGSYRAVSICVGAFVKCCSTGQPNNVLETSAQSQVHKSILREVMHAMLHSHTDSRCNVRNRLPVEDKQLGINNAQLHNTALSPQRLLHPQGINNPRPLNMKPLLSTFPHCWTAYPSKNEYAPPWCRCDATSPATHHTSHTYAAHP
jgi:hypothetical protein